MKRAKTLITAAEHSVGSKEAPEAARIELRHLLGDMDVYISRLEELLRSIAQIIFYFKPAIDPSQNPA